MSEANTIYDTSGRIVATAEHGVAWRRVPRERLGEYDDGESGAVYDNLGQVAGHFSNGEIVRPDSSSVGRCVASELPSSGGVAKRLYLGNREVGHCIGSVGAASAVLLLLFTTPACTQGDADA